MSFSSMLYRLNRASVWRRSLRVWGRRVRACSADRLLYLLLHRAGLMGKAEQRFLRRRVRAGMKVADIGANVGLYSLLLAERAGPTGQVFAFEPEPGLFRALAHNCRRSGLANLTLFNQALGDCPGRVRFHRSLFNSGDNRLGDFGWLGQGVEVDMVRLDDVLTQPRIDFIKMDVQGHEMRVLCGMEEVLRASPALEIYFEFWPAGLRAADTEPAALLDHLGRRGFGLYALDEDSPRPVRGWSAREGHLRGSRYVNLLASRLR